MAPLPMPLKSRWDCSRCRLEDCSVATFFLIPERDLMTGRMRVHSMAKLGSNIKDGQSHE